MYERIPTTESVISLSSMMLPSATIACSSAVRVILAGGSMRALVYSGITGSYRLNAGCGWASMMLVSKYDLTVPMSFQYPANGYATTLSSPMAPGMICLPKSWSSGLPSSTSRRVPALKM
jgi:hypothetical protein